MTLQSERDNNLNFTHSSTSTGLWTVDKKEKDYKDSVNELLKLFSHLSNMASTITEERHFDPKGEDRYIRQNFAELLGRVIEPMRQAIKLSADYIIEKTVFNTTVISVEEFNKILFEKEEILLIDYRNTRSDQLSFKGMDNIMVVELDTCWLTEHFSYDIVKNKIPNYRDKQMLDWKKFFHIVVIDEDDSDSIKKDILMKELEKVKGFSLKKLNIVSLDGGFKKFRQSNPDNVESTTEPFKERTMNRLLSFRKSLKSVRSNTEKKISLQRIKNKGNISFIEDRRNMSLTIEKKNSKKIQEKLYRKDDGQVEFKENEPLPSIDDDIEKIIIMPKIVKDIAIKRKYPDPNLFNNTPLRNVDENAVKKKITLKDIDEVMYQGAIKVFENNSTVGLNGLEMAGLKNLGNTCFMNVVLQVLLRLPELRTAFEYESVTNILKATGRDTSQGKIAIVFAAFMDVFWKNKHSVINPRYFLDIFSKEVSSIFNDGCQHDAQEFQIYLLNALRKVTSSGFSQENFDQNYNGENVVEDFNDYKRRTEQFLSSKINSLFYLETASTVKCLSCNHQSVKFERSSQISVELITDNLPNPSLSRCLEKYYSEEILDDEWKCPKCNEKRPATKTQKIMELPEVLVIHEKRFIYINGRCEKNDNYVDFELENFDMSPYVHEKMRTGNEILYDLYAIVCHKGKLTGGHYTSYVKSNGIWLLCDDTSVTRLYQNAAFRFENSYLLYYVLKK